MEAGSVSHTPSLSLNNDNAMSPRGGFWMMIGCGYCVKTIRRGRYLYFWHYEDRVGGRRQIEEYIGPSTDPRAREAVTQRVAAYAEQARSEIDRFVRQAKAEMVSVR